MATKRGIDFEKFVRKKLKDAGYLVDKLHDAPPPYSKQKPSDLYVYRCPHLIFVECKTTNSNTFNFKSNLRDNQINMMLDAVKYDGVQAFVVIRFVNHKFIFVISIQEVKSLIDKGYKSINANKIHDNNINGKIIKMNNRRTYDLKDFEKN